MSYNKLYQEIKKKRSFLCIGLDPDPDLMPKHLLGEQYPVYAFNKQIIDATARYCVAYKPNFAFYESEGYHGWNQLEMTVSYIKKNYPDTLIIADAKRGDIGNTAKQYAKAIFKSMDCDAVTLSPYMGSDSITPFLNEDNKWAIVLALTSNPSASDFEEVILSGDQPLYRYIIEKSIKSSNDYLIKRGEDSKDRLMFVVGATRPEKLKEIRSFCPDHFFLVPGVGAQGGTIQEVAENGMNSRCGILVNVSRSIIFADNSEMFYRHAAEAAEVIVEQMKQYV